MLPSRRIERRQAKGMLAAPLTPWPCRHAAGRRRRRRHYTAYAVSPRSLTTALPVGAFGRAGCSGLSAGISAIATPFVKNERKVCSTLSNMRRFKGYKPMQELDFL